METSKKAEVYASDADSSREDMKALMEAMERISDTSKKIENIISDIESIASQTNLLSLNAAIEEQVRQVRALQLLPSRLELLQTRVHSQQLIQEVLLKVL